MGSEEINAAIAQISSESFKQMLPLIEVENKLRLAKIRLQVAERRAQLAFIETETAYLTASETFRNCLLKERHL